MTQYLPDCVAVGPDTADKAVIWLHGLGADGHDFEAIVPELNLPANNNIRFVFPHAPQQPVTINGGMVMRAWYDISSMQIDQEQDDNGIRASERLISGLIEREVGRGIEYDRIILAGFSQGGAIALHTGLRLPKTLAGIMALSAYLPLADSLASEAQAENRATSVFMGHGKYDPVVPYALGESSRDILQNMGYRIDWHAYPMEHSVHPQEIVDISTWLKMIYKL